MWKDKKRFDRLVAVQHGRVTRAQLKHLGLTDREIDRRVERGELIQVLPRVYAVGHLAPSREADLWAAVLYAGPGAMLSHGTAAQWRGLIDYAPSVIEVSTPRKINSIGGVKVYGRRERTRDHHMGLPVTAIPETLVDLAATASLKAVQRALAVLDYRNELDVPALEAACEHGRAGSRRLKEALEIHQPALAHTNGAFEERFLEWCERWKIPVPEFNVRVHGVLVDAHWPGTNLVVELDGGGNHRSPAQLHRDMTRDLTLRSHGVTVHRYGWAQLGVQARQIRDEILAALRAAD